jgi:hypothetical protein
VLEGLKCRIRGHKTLCSQVITLDPEGVAELDHTHQCVKCSKTTVFPLETLDSEIALMLRNLVGPQNMAVSMDTDPPTYIH